MLVLEDMQEMLVWLAQQSRALPMHDMTGLVHSIIPPAPFSPAGQDCRCTSERI
jgi:hypothetical protein